MKKIQKVVRTIPSRPGSYYNSGNTEKLQKLLSDGYYVVMCNPTGNYLEYIVEKVVEE